MKSFVLENQEHKKVLTSEEFNNYFSLYKNGDINARNEIVEHNFPLVYLIVSRYFESYKAYKEDLFSVGYMALMNAIEKYDPNYGTEFSTFASSSILRNLNRYCEKFIKRYNKLYSLDANPGTDDEGEHPSLYGLTKNDNDEIEELVNRDYLNYLLAFLTKKITAILHIIIIIILVIN